MLSILKTLLMMISLAVSVNAYSKSEITLKKLKVSPKPKDDKDDLQRLSNQIDQLHAEVDRLETNAQMNKQKMIATSKNGIQLDVEVSFVGMGNTHVRYLDIKLDNSQLYLVNENTGIWRAQKPLPIYSGPIKVGSHTLALNAVVAHQKADSERLSDYTTSALTDSLPFVIQPTQKTMSIKLELLDDAGTLKLVKNPTTTPVEQTEQSAEEQFKDDDE